MIEVKIELSQERYVELIKNEEKYKQYKQFLINTTTNKNIEFLKAVERKNIWDLTQENKNKEENNYGKNERI